MSFLDKFKTKTKKVFIKEWGEEVEIKQLSLGEKNEVDYLMLKGKEQDLSQKDGKIKVEIELDKFNESVFLAVSYALVNPKMSLEDVKALNADAMAGILEVKAHLDDWEKTEDKEVEEGN